MTISRELTRFLDSIALLSNLDPATLDDAQDILDALSDSDLARVCAATAGQRVHKPQKSLCYSCELRARLWDELATLELELPEDNAEGRIRKVLKRAMIVVN